MPLKSAGLKPGDGWTKTSFITTEAFGKLLTNESLTEPASILVRILLFSVFRMMPVTLSCIRKAAEKRIKRTEDILISKIRAILGKYLMFSTNKLQSLHLKSPGPSIKLLSFGYP